MANQPAVPHEVLGPEGARLVLLHGFTQTRHCWGPVPAALAGRVGRQVVLADAPGHGEAAKSRLTLTDAGAVYGDTLGPAAWLGYSMGGRLALHVALARPAAVEALVLVGSSPGLADPDERARRRRDDEALAAHLETIGVPAFVDEWLATPLFAGLPPAAAHRNERLANTAEGLASSLRLAGTGAQEPLWDRLSELACPVLLVTGADDTRFTGIAADMAGRISHGEHAVVPGAGHSVHLEQPDAFIETVGDWLLRLGADDEPRP
jgi:2-succinyl-6-hydroxy-2,4-cyclohexadiene-1-carboxylate synthase